MLLPIIIPIITKPSHFYLPVFQYLNYQLLIYIGAVHIMPGLIGGSHLSFAIPSTENAFF